MPAFLIFVDMRIGYLYQLMAGTLFFCIGLYFLLAGENIFEGTLGEGWHKGFAYVVMGWACFKWLNAYLLFKKKNRE